MLTVVGPTSIYDLAYWSYIVAFLHYGSEILYYRTARIRGPAFAPCVVSSKLPHDATISRWPITDNDAIATSLIWITLMRSHYVASY